MEKDTKNVPKAFQVQFSRLFGESSKIARTQKLTDRQWRKALKRLLDEIYHYIEENVNTDELHYIMLCSGLASASNSLENDNFFWPGYIEGITRLCLLLLGDYPDYHRRKAGKKTKEHYKLNNHRILCYTQDADQKVRVLRAATRMGLLDKAHEFSYIMGEFRNEKGFNASYKDFLRWYRERYPGEYSKLF
jgi:predicted house-cleaning noncanonical NTP pyrophosphatase (MazG superfamily)